MKNNKFCISRTLVYLVLLIVAVFGGFYLVNRINNQKNLSSKPQAANKINCLSSVNYCNPNDKESKKFYIGYEGKEKKYFKFSNCTGEIEEGISNYCNYLYDKCVKEYCPNDLNKPLYTNMSLYFIDSSCKGLLMKKEDNGKISAIVNLKEAQQYYCNKNRNEILPIEYTCSNGRIVFFYKDGKYYKDPEAKKEIIDKDIGNYCKSAWIKVRDVNPTLFIDPFENKLIALSCDNLKELLNITPIIGMNYKKRYISVLADEYYSDGNISMYFLGTSKSSPIAVRKEDARDYCQTPDPYQFNKFSCLGRLCDPNNIKGEKFYIMGGVIYSDIDCSNTATISAVCK